MRIKILCILMVLIFMIGCSPVEEIEEEANEEPEVESPEPVVTVDEEVVVPAHEPEPEPEPEPTEDELLADHNDSDHFLKGSPDVGQTISKSPRKVMLTFNYPLVKGTAINVFDKDTKSYSGKTIIANEEGVVAFTYLEELPPGIYRVEYKAVFAGKTEGEDTGYYHLQMK